MAAFRALTFRSSGDDQVEVQFSDSNRSFGRILVKVAGAGPANPNDEITGESLQAARARIKSFATELLALVDQP